jgi:hypothetical protein
MTSANPQTGQTHYPYMTIPAHPINAHIRGFCCGFGCGPANPPPFIAQVVGPRHREDTPKHPPVLQPVPFFEAFIDHAFLDTTNPIPTEHLDAARLLVAMSGDPHEGLAALDDLGLISLLASHRP